MNNWDQQLIDEFYDAAESIDMRAHDSESSADFKLGMFWASGYLRELAESVRERASQ